MNPLQQGWCAHLIKQLGSIDSSVMSLGSIGAFSLLVVTVIPGHLQGLDYASIRRVDLSY